VITLLSIRMGWCDRRESLRFRPDGMISPRSILFRFTSIMWTLATRMNDTCAVCPVLVVNRQYAQRYLTIWATLHTAAHDSHTLQSRNKQASHLPFDSFKPLGLINCSILSVDAHLWPQPTTYIDENNRNCKLVCAITLMENL
jgi:hypothetical protein